jgi:VanZ family protein
MIFSFSAQNGDTSGGLSETITTYVLQTYDFFFHPEDAPNIFVYRMDFIQFVIRKTAHVSEYFALCMSLLLPLNRIFSKKKHVLLISSITSFVFAGLDEYHQTFIPGRMGSITDVFIDSIGIALACSIFYIACSILTKKNKNLKSILYYFLYSNEILFRKR